MSIASIGTPFQQSLIDNDNLANQKTTKKEMGKEDFLTLLVAQLKHQDPLNPMESVEFTAQLAQFSSLEQLFGVNDTLGNIQNSISAQEDGNLLDYIGKVARIDDNLLSLHEGKADNGGYILEEPAKTVTISIFNEQGIEVRTITKEKILAGEHTIDWDGRDNDGKELKDGAYTFEVNAINEDEKIIFSRIYAEGEVTGVTYEGLLPYLIVGNREIVPADILTVTKPVDQ